ncbi:Peptidase propeptide and YPEB domain-containing protein [Nocardioides exalbidus]|uniref:Peptidase propeptide and YPEB domain-containing protein n=1 Tax=Nocardioides exalbidus TaxID=402596 RepID=A0A1H4KMP8_9ACTN|nr:PepSY domain-containing protein [Nocardioides exalbidus]SEB59824.1 Peptidase propeptide and YPEB domain-containing protein [Nocardioides exalbidus]
MNTLSRRTRLATAAVLAPLALGLVACGGDDDSDDAPVTSASGTAAPSEGAASTTIEGDVETAAQTALGEVDGTVFSVDHDGQGWDVTIVTADGEENDIELNADATEVTRGPVADTDQDADDAAERETLLGASLDYAAAIEAAAGEVQGTVTGVDLSDDNGTAVWEVQLDEDTPNESTVDVDAETGEVLRVELDD